MPTYRLTLKFHKSAVLKKEIVAKDRRELDEKIKADAYLRKHARIK
jgi:hypothetical protein